MSRGRPRPSKPRRLARGGYSCKYRWTDNNGGGHCRTVQGATSAEATALAQAGLDAALRDVERGKVGLPPVQRRRVPTFAQLAERAETECWPTRGGRKHTAQGIQRVRDYWLPVVGDMLITAITPGDVGAVIARAKRAGRSPATCNRILAAGSVVLAYALSLRLVESNVARAAGLRQTEPKRRKEVLTLAELHALVDAIDPGWRPLIGLMVYAGLRLGEAQSVRGEDVDLPGRYVTVRTGGHTDTTKGKAARRVPMAPPLVDILANVPLRRGRRVSQFLDPRAALERAATQAGITLHVHSHLLRHSWASALGQAGVSGPVIQQAMGHADLSTTERYLHVDVTHEHVDAAFGSDS